MDESGSENDRASSDRCLAGLTGDIGSVEVVADGRKALARTHASNSDSELWTDVDLASTSAVLEAWVSVEVPEGNGASLGAVITSIDGALLTDEKRGIATRWDLFGISPAFSWHRREVVLSSTGGQYGVSASALRLGLSSSRASHVEVRNLSSMEQPRSGCSGISVGR
jgi:hypothetical protein